MHSSGMFSPLTSHFPSIVMLRYMGFVEWSSICGINYLLGPLTRFYRLIHIDDFVGKLWETHLAVKKEGYVQVRRAKHRKGFRPTSCRTYRSASSVQTTWSTLTRRALLLVLD